MEAQMLFEVVGDVDGQVKEEASSEAGLKCQTAALLTRNHSMEQATMAGLRLPAYIHV